MNRKKTLFGIGITVIILIRGLTMFNVVNPKIVNQDYSLSKFIKAEVDIPTRDMILKAGNKCHVSCPGLEENVPKVEVKDSKSRIGFKSQTTRIRLFNFKQLNSKIIIKMPREQLENLNVDNSNSNLSADCLAVEIGDIDLSNGSTNVRDLRTKGGISFDTSRGNIRAENSNTTGYDLDTPLGKITTSSRRHGDSFEKNNDSRGILETDTSLGSVSVSWSIKNELTIC